MKITTMERDWLVVIVKSTRLKCQSTPCVLVLVWQCPCYYRTYYVLFLLWLKKKSNFDDEKRVFNSKWELMYLCIVHNNKPMCLICLQVISVLKKYNISIDITRACTNHMINILEILWSVFKIGQIKKKGFRDGELIKRWAIKMAMLLETKKWQVNLKPYNFLIKLLVEELIKWVMIMYLPESFVI